jgi:hypothetical protein
VTVGTAAVVVAAVLGLGFVVQRTTLRTPSEATLTALRSAIWLERYRLVDSTITLDNGRVLHGRCLQDWVVEAGRRRRGAILRLDDGYELLAVPPHTLSATGGAATTRATSPLVLMELAGCPRVLARRLQTLAQERHGLRLANDRLSFDLKGTSLTLTLAPHTGAPVGVTLVTPTVRGTSRIRFTPVTTRLRQLLGVSGR